MTNNIDLGFTDALVVTDTRSEPQMLPSYVDSEIRGLFRGTRKIWRCRPREVEEHIERSKGKIGAIVAFPDGESSVEEWKGFDGVCTELEGVGIFNRPVIKQGMEKISDAKANTDNEEQERDLDGRIEYLRALFRKFSTPPNDMKFYASRDFTATLERYKQLGPDSAEVQARNSGPVKHLDRIHTTEASTFEIPQGSPIMRIYEWSVSEEIYEAVTYIILGGPRINLDWSGYRRRWMQRESQHMTESSKWRIDPGQFGPEHALRSIASGGEFISTVDRFEKHHDSILKSQ